MKSCITNSFITTVATLGITSALAQSGGLDPDSSSLLRNTGPQNPNRIGFSYRSGFKPTVQFLNLGGLTPPQGINPGPATGFQVDRTYEDGYNRVDDNANSYGDLHATRNWGYSSPGQVVDSEGSRFVEMHVTSSPATAATAAQDEDPMDGMEIFYSRELQDRGGWKWGFEAALGYAAFNAADGTSLNADVSRLTDAFEVPLDEGTNERYLPPAPYAGSDAPGPLLGSEPARSIETLPAAATITGQRKFTADIFSFRVGPYVEIPIARKLSLNLGAGFALIHVSSDLEYSAETVTTAPSLNLSSAHPASASSKSEILPAAYAAASMAWRLDSNWTIQGGLEYQWADTYSHSDPGSARIAVMDLGKTVYGVLSVGYSF